MHGSAASERHLDAVPDADAVTGTTSFEVFFEEERRRLFRALYLITGSVQEAEELTQDAFLKVWERWQRVGAMESPEGYLYRVAMNASRSRYRRLLRAAKGPLAYEATEDPYGPADARDAVVRAVRALPARQRQALVSTDLLDLGTETVASLMGVTPSTVRSLVSQAHAALKAAMEDQDE